MELSKRNKIGLALVGLGLVALGVDQFVLQAGSSDEDASAAAVPPQQLLVAPPATAVPPPAAAEGDSLAFLLRGIYVHRRLGMNSVRDAFAPPPSPVVAVESAPPPHPEAPPAAQDLSRKFAAGHQLTGVMVAGRRSQALVNGKFIAIGQTIDGFKLVEVTKGSATFAREGTRAQLVLNSKNSAPARSATAMTE